MDPEQFSSQWLKLKKEINKKWNKIAGIELNEIAGKKTKLISAVRKHYGLEKEIAEKEIDDWLKKLKNLI